MDIVENGDLVLVECDLLSYGDEGLLLLGTEEL